MILSNKSTRCVRGEGGRCNDGNHSQGWDGQRDGGDNMSLSEGSQYDGTDLTTQPGHGHLARNVQLNYFLSELADDLASCRADQDDRT